MEKLTNKPQFLVHKNGAKKSEEEFLWEMKEIYGNKYDLSNVKYVSCNTNVKLICPIHGEFERTPKSLLKGDGCIKCKKLEKNRDNFFNKFEKLGNKTVDLSNAVYVKDDVDVECKCKICGNIWNTTPHKLLIGHGCPLCGIKKVWQNRSDRTEKNKIIKRMKSIFPEYNFDKNDDITTQKQTIIVTCHKHGDFKTTPDAILHKHGCKKCAHDKLRKLFSFSKDKIIELAKKVHGNSYIYPEYSEYKGVDLPMKIVCPIHGEFEQTPYGHITLRQGCPICKQSHLEEEIRLYLQENKIEFIQETKRKDLPWLGLQRLDFYLPKYNIAIECQGEQHYRPLSFSRDKSKETEIKNFNVIQKRDQRKKQLCEEHGVKLLYFTHYKDVEESEILFKTKEKLLSFIIK